MSRGVPPLVELLRDGLKNGRIEPQEYALWSLTMTSDPKRCQTMVKEGVIQQAKVIRAANAAKARTGDSWAEEEYRALLYKFADSADTAKAAAAVEDQRVREERQEEERKQQAAEQSCRRVQEQKERGRRKRSCCLSCFTNCLFFGVLFTSGRRPQFLRASCQCGKSC